MCIYVIQAITGGWNHVKGRAGFGVRRVKCAEEEDNDSD